MASFPICCITPLQLMVKKFNLSTSGKLTILKEMNMQ